MNKIVEMSRDTIESCTKEKPDFKDIDITYHLYRNFNIALQLIFPRLNLRSMYKAQVMMVLEVGIGGET